MVEQAAGLPRSLWKFFTAAVCILYCSKLPAQHFVFDHYSQKNGLSFNDVTDIAQDTFGFIWIATNGGINRFDGLQFKIFYSDYNDSTTPSGDFCYEIFEDKNGYIWFATTPDSISRYNPVTGTFKRFNFSGIIPYTFRENSRSELFMMSEKGLCKYDEKTETIQLLTFKNGKPIYPGSTKRIFFNSENRLFLATKKGVFEVDFNKDTTLLLDGTELYGANSLQILEDSRGHLIIGTWGGGLIDYNLQTHTYERYGAMDNKNNFWIFTDITIRNENGQQVVWGASVGPNILTVNLSTKTFSEYNVSKHFLEREDPISITNVFKDKNDALWFGTNYGIIKIDPLKQLFQTVLLNEILPGLNQSGITAIYIDTAGNKENIVWLGVLNEGLFTYNLKSKQLEKIQLPEAFHKSFYTPKILRRNNNEIWIATNHGLLKYQEKERKFLQFKNDPEDETSISGNFISDLQLDAAQRLWVATHYEGLNIFIDSCNCFKRIFAGNTLTENGKIISENINDIALSPDGSLWVARGFYGDRQTAISKINTQTLHQTHYYKNSKSAPDFPLNRDIFTIYVDASKTVWSGYELGMFYFKHEEKETVQEYRNVSLADNLASSAIFSIEQTGKYLWLLGNNSLTIFDSQTNKVVCSYLHDDGLLSPQMSAIEKGSHGIIFLSDMRGFQWVDTSIINPNKIIPQVYITTIKVLDKLYLKENKTALFTSSVSLKHHQNKITFEFVALNFTNPENNVFAYMLEGLDKDWIYSSENAVNYNNLSPGKYVFKVKACNDNGIWNETGDTLQLTVIPPWYNTAWFYIACIAFAAALLYLTYRIRLAQILRIEKLRNKISRDLHDDVGSSLSSINMLSTLARQKLADDDEKTKELLKKINATAGYTMENMSDIVWAINPKNDSLADIRIRMQEYLTDTLEAKGIQYTFSVDEEILQTKLSMDIRRDFYLIFKEAVNNLAKYSGATSAEIHITQTSNVLQLTVKDNGKGFDVYAVNSGNGLKNYKSRAQNIGGKITIQSSPGTGTEILLEVPLR